MAETTPSTGGYAAGSAPGYSPVAGAAMGRIIIDTSQAEQAPGKMAGVAQGINNAMNQVSSGASNAASGISMLTRTLGALSGAFGISFGAAGIIQLGKMAIGASETATAYNRQAVAARSLAGSQAQLNQLLKAYEEATGGAIDKSTELANVTKLMAVGFADNVPELEKFATVIRGISIAMGSSEDYVTQQLILELFSQRGNRLDQLGLIYAEVKQRADELKASDASLTDQMAYQNAVLEQAQEKFGTLSKSAEGQKTGLEKAGAAAKDFGLVFGEVVGPLINVVGEDVARTFTRWQEGLQGALNLAHMLGVALGTIPAAIPTGSIASRTGIGANMRDPGLIQRPDSAELSAAKLDWSKGILELNKQTSEDLLQQNEDYQRQRADSESNYQKSVARSAEDFARSRQRAEEDFAESIADIRTNALRREQDMAEDLGRNIAKAQADSDERIAKARENAAERLADLEEDYQRNREKAARHFANSIKEAAGNLDAAQVAELQRNYEEQQKDAEEAHEEQRDDLQKQLNERLEDERKNLAKSIAQQNEAHERRLEDAREADAQRIIDMQTDFDKRKEQEDIDYGIRMDRMAQDHQDQLDEMGRAHGLRIQQIKDHAEEERTQLDDEHKLLIDELEGHHSKYHDSIVKADDAALKEFSRLTNPVRVWMRQPSQPLVIPNAPNLNNAYDVPGSASNPLSFSQRSSHFSGDVNVTIAGSTNMGEEEMYRVARKAFVDALQEVVD